MVNKYRVVCKSCNHEMGVFKTAKIEMPPKCDVCGSTKIATIPYVPKDEVQQLNFDIVIFNKKTGVSKTTGFFVSQDTMKKHGKNLVEMKKILATEMAKAIHNVVKSDALLVDLLKGGDE